MINKEVLKDGLKSAGGIFEAHTQALILIASYLDKNTDKIELLEARVNLLDKRLQKLEKRSGVKRIE